jgi:nucleoside-diphosphate-sugar epimerase
MVMESEEAINEDFNLSTSTATTVLEMANLIWDILNPEMPFEYVCEAGYEYDVQKRVPDTTKSKEILGFQAQVSLRESVVEVINYMKSKKHREVTG